MLKMDNTTNFDFDPDGYGKKGVRKPVAFPELRHFDHLPSGYHEIVLTPKWNVSGLTGRNGSRILYEDDSWLMSWKNIKTSGSHNDSGKIYVKDKSSQVKAKETLDDMIARFYVDRGKAWKLSIKEIKTFYEKGFKKDIPFIKNIDNHKDMPLYDSIKKLFK